MTRTENRMFRSESSMGKIKPITRVEKNKCSDERENSYRTPIDDLLLENISRNEKLVEIPIEELIKPIEVREKIVETPEREKSQEEEIRETIKEEEKKKLYFISPVNKEWLDSRKEAFISSENIESVKQQIKKLGKIRLKNIDDDEQLINQLVFFKSGTPIYNTENRDPIKFTDDILALPIMTENTSQQYIYVGNYSDNERKDRNYTKYITPKGEHLWNTLKTGIEFSTTNGTAVILRKSIYGKNKIKQYW